MVQRISIGPNGEFFVETTEGITAEQIPLLESVYKMVLTARTENNILNEAMDEGED